MTLVPGPTRDAGTLHTAILAVAALALLLLGSILAPPSTAAAPPPLAGATATVSAPDQRSGSLPNAVHSTSPVALRHAGGGSAPGTVPSLAPASGRGLFFNSSQIAQAPIAVCATLFGYACVNDSYDPSINLSAPPPHGGTGDVLGVAFTQVTNASPCIGLSNYSQTEVGFAYSTDLGGTWSTPTYLGLTNCSEAALLPSAYQPTLTSLANGTFVLAYIAYNNSNPYTAWFQQDLGGAGGYYSITGGALVLTESYDGGVSWTAPRILNESLNLNVLTNCCDANDTHAFTPQRPWITAIGDTIYLAWTNDTFSAGFDYYCQVQVYTYSACHGAGSSQVHLLVSKNGGASWSPPSDLATVRSVWNQSVSVGENPYVLVSTNGTVFVAYVTDYYLSNWSVRVATGNYLASGAIEVAESSDNGTTFRYATAATNLSMYAANPPYQGGLWGIPVAPQLAWGARYSQLYLTWTMDTWGVNVYCPKTCPDNNLYENIFFSNSSDAGATWSAFHLVSAALNDSLGSAAYNPAVAVLPDGEVDIATAFTDLNQSVNYCYGASFGYWFYCGPVREEYLSSVDNGTTFSAPILISDNISANPNSDPSGWYDTATVVNGSFYVAWAQKYADTGPGNISLWPGTCCGYALVRSQIAVSHLETGPGLTLSYKETGLPTGFRWGVDIMGNEFSAVAPGAITVTGVVPGENLTWASQVVPGSSYGYRYLSNETPLPPMSFTTSSTIYENYSEQVFVTISTDPYGTQCPTLGNQAYFHVCWDPAQSYYYHFDHNVLPFVGSGWLPYNTPVTLNASPANMCFSSTLCPIYTTWLNLTFQSWTGSGAGSTNTSNEVVTIVPKGPVNETATFQIIGICTNPNVGGFSPHCSLNESLAFHESGLPAGTQWNVSIENDAGLTAAGSSTTPTITVVSGATTGLVNYTIWTVPSSTPGKIWIPTGFPSNPIELPVDRVVNVSFALGAASSGVFTIALNESGLPQPTVSGWSFDLGSSAIGLRAAQTQLTVAGGSYSVDIPGVYFANDSGFYAAAVSIQRYLVNGSAPVRIVSLPANVTIDGPSLVTVYFAAEFFLTVATTQGGTASPGSEWVPSGQPVTLLATASADYHFVGWSGAGVGGASGSAPNITVRPKDPVTETATFEWNGPSLWNLQVNVAGAPAGTGFSVSVGNVTYASTGSFTIGGLTTGDYPVAVPIAYSNASALTRYVASITSSSLSFVGPNVLSITTNGTLNLTFATQFQVTYSATPGGTIVPVPGAYWEPSGASASLLATPSPGYGFDGWVGAGPGAVTASSASIAPVANGPISELAQFSAHGIAVPSAYSLTISESGLPSGALWGVQLGPLGAAGATSALTVSGLNGSYAVTVPPVSTGYGVEYVPTNAPVGDLQIASNSTLDIAFQEELWVGVSSSVGGSVGSSSGWVAAGSSVSIVASPSPGWGFIGWQGTGAGSYTGNSSSTSFTPTGAVNETATFLPVQVTTSSATGPGPWLPIGVAVVLLLVGVAVGALVVRRGRRPKSPDGPEAPPEFEPEPEPGSVDPPP